jgi:Xaa-Pro aminopeptidase
LNSRKSKKEIRYLTRAAKITRGIFGVISKKIKPGAGEREIAGRIGAIIKKKGLKRSFRTIVASGPNAANPHAKLTGRKIKKNDLVVVDFGVVYKGFHSDMTRTVIVGKMSARMRKLYNAVKAAQKEAIGSMRAGLRISEFVTGIHASLRKKGLGKYMRHGLGHGLGKKVHEAPKLSEKNKGILKKGTVVTIEPGLYIKGAGGVRIEDAVLIRENGSRVLAP